MELDVDLVGKCEENPEGDIDVVVVDMFDNVELDPEGDIDVVVEDMFDNVELDGTNVVLTLQKLITGRSRKL